MGWMSWATFYCEINCKAHPDHCINEKLYRDMADHLGMIKAASRANFRLLLPKQTFKTLSFLLTFYTFLYDIVQGSRGRPIF